MDLNCDLGESFGSWTIDDTEILDVITSANIACGYHAGDAATMVRTTHAAAERGLRIGAHVGYRDLAGFGRRNIDYDSATLTAEVTYQIGALAVIAAAEGTHITYVKPHGALYNTAQHDEKQAQALVDGILRARALCGELALMTLPDGVVKEIAEAQGLTTITEGFADRAYEGNRLVPRTQPGAVLHDPDRCAQQARTLNVDSICVHGDTPGALAIARAVKAAL